jgi:hypothetical protein
MQIVPQYIDVEDKIAGPLTWKHIGWLFAGGVLLVLAWVTLDRITFYVVAFVIVSATVALAFARPNGVSMIEFIGYGVGYFFRPKTYLWQREVEHAQTKKKKDVHITSTSKEKELTTEDVVALAQTLDTHGAQRSERIKQLIKEREKTVKK